MDLSASISVHLRLVFIRVHSWPVQRIANVTAHGAEPLSASQARQRSTGVAASRPITSPGPYLRPSAV